MTPDGLFLQQPVGYCAGVHHRMISIVIVTLIVACFPLACTPRASSPAQAPALEGTAVVEGRVLDLVNQHRYSVRLGPLTSHDLLVKEARRHSAAMAAGRVPLGHGGFEERRRCIAHSIPFHATAENVGFVKGYADPADHAVDQWLKSPDHARNIEGSYVLTGIGVAEDDGGGVYVTQIFWRPATEPDSIDSARPRTR